MPMFALQGGIATSQVVNDQAQYGDVIASGQLDVVDQSDDTTAVTTATGNALTGQVVSGDLDVQSGQEMYGAASAETIVNVAVNGGGQTTVTTAVTGNTSDVGISGGGLLTGTFSQYSGTGGYTAHTQVNGDTAETGAVAFSNQAIANSAGFGITDSTADVTVSQANNSDVVANGGATFQYMPGDGYASSAVVGNNLTTATADATTQAVAFDQAIDAAIAQATFFASYGNSQNTVTNATASANNANLTNAGGSLDVTGSQTNNAYVRAQAEETSYDYGGATSVAYGVGNSVLAGNLGPALFLDNNQVNTGGGIESVASFSGNTGYDAQVSSTAMGNAVTGYACSNCQATIDVRSRQVNTADIGARSNVTVGNTGRSSRATTTAVGNTASFYVTTP